MSKRNKILLCIVAAIVIIGLVTGALTFGDIVGSLFGERAAEIVTQADVIENTSPVDIDGEDLVLLEEEPGQSTEQAEPKQEEQAEEQVQQPEQPVIDENGSYSSKDDVALYIHTYGHLPHNFITKNEARELGWEGGSVEDYAPGYSIGGDRFGNYEGVLPEGKKYTECDIDTLGRSSRGAKRIVFSNDGCIYYTDDHYETFELLYGEE